MILQTASENDIRRGQGVVMGMVRSDTGDPAWALPGGMVTANRALAERVASEIGRIISRHP